MRLVIACCAAALLAARCGAATLSEPAGAGPGALHASPLAIWGPDAALSASAGPAETAPLLRALELRGLTPAAYAALDEGAKAAAVAGAQADLRAEASVEADWLLREAAAADPASPDYPVLVARLAQLSGPLAAYAPEDKRASLAFFARTFVSHLAPEKRAALEERLRAVASSLAPGRDATAVEAAAAELPRVPAALMTPGVARLRKAQASRSRALVRPAVASGPLFRAKVGLVKSGYAAKTVAGRYLYRSIKRLGQTFAREAGEFLRAWTLLTEPHRHPYRWSVVKALHRNGDFTGAFGHATYDGDPKILSTTLGDATEDKNVEELAASLAGQEFKLRDVTLTPGLGISGMSNPQITPQAHLALLYINLKLAKEQGVRLLHNTGEGSPRLLLGYLEGDSAKIKQGVISWLKENGQLEDASWDEAKIVATVDLLMGYRDELFKEFSPEDLRRVQIVAQFGAGLNGIRRDDDEQKIDFDKLRAVADSPFVAMIQFKLKQAAKRGAKVDPSKMGLIWRAHRELSAAKKYKSPEVIADFANAEAVAGVVKAARAVTSKPVSLKFGVGNVRDVYAKLQYWRDARALPDHIQVDGADKEFSPGSGNAPPEADTSLPSDQATIAMDAMLKKLGVRDQVFLDVSGGILWPVDAVHKLALGADGVCAARGWLGMGVGCVMAKKCDGREGMGCPEGIASAATSLTAFSLDPVRKGRQGYVAAANFHKEYVKMLAEAGVTDAWKARELLGLHNPLSAVQVLDARGRELPLDTLYSREVVADTLRGALSPDEVDRYVFGRAAQEPRADGTFDAGVAQALLGPFASLPARGSAEWRALVAQAKAGLDPRAGPGHAVLDLRRYLPPQAGDLIHRRLPPASQVRDFDTGEVLKGRSVSHISPEDRAAMRVFTSWLEDLLGEALGKRPRADLVQLRAWSRGERGLTAPAPHVDGGDVSALVALKGSGVVYRPDGSEEDRPLLAGEVLLFSGTERAKSHPGLRPTVHRSPAADEDRLLLVVRLSE